METKTTEIANVELKLNNDGRTFEGYASVFNGVDSYGDTILPGAYKEILSERKNPIKMFFNHNSYQLPIGKWEDIAEDSKGLHVKGKLTPGLALSEDVYAALKDGTLDGLSIGYSMVGGKYSIPEEGKRIIEKIGKLYEISVVTFPADKAAVISGVKTDLDLSEVKTVRELEDILRDSGFSRSNAQKLIAVAKTAIKSDMQRESAERANDELKACLERINQLCMRK